MRKFYFSLVVIFLSLNLRPAITALGPLLGVIKEDLGMSSFNASLLTTLPVFCMGLFALLAVKLTRRFSIEHSLLCAMLLIFSALSSRLFIDTSWLLILTALLAGMGIGIAGPLIAGLIKKHYPDSQYLMSFYSVSMVIGAALAASLAIPLYQQFNHSWQHSLGFWSSIALIAGVLILPLSSPQKRLAQKTAQPMASLPDKKRPWLLMVFFSLMAGIFYSITAWLAPYVQSLGFTPKESGLILTLFTMVQIPISFLIPWIVSRTKKPIPWLLFCGFSELIGLALLLLNVSPWIITLFLGVGSGGLFPLAIMLPMTQSKTAAEAISLSAFMQSGGFMLGSSGPLMFGFASDRFNSFTPAWIIVMFLVCLMFITITRLRRKIIP